MNTIKINSKETKMIAHRGLSGIERENTCPAFVAAGNRSYYGIETDVHVTKDGKFVIIHDETTERVSQGKYSIDVEKNEYSEVEKIILPDLDNTTDRQDIRIPLLAEYIKICKKYEKICVLEIKNHFDEKDIDRLLDEIKALGYLENVDFISFDFANCVNVRKRLPEHNVQFLTENEITDELVEKLIANNLDLDIYYKLLNKEKIEMLHSKGIKVNCWTCDEKDVAEALVSYGIEFITSNILE
jgi:glycerophosphoryl diester phosphodiesterase